MDYNSGNASPLFTPSIGGYGSYYPNSPGPSSYNSSTNGYYSAGVFYPYGGEGQYYSSPPPPQTREERRRKKVVISSATESTE